MNSKDRAALRKSLEGRLPKDFDIEQYDDYLNYQHVDPLRSYDDRIVRVARVVGPRRYVLVFNYPTCPQQHSRFVLGSHTLSFLGEDGTLVPFNPNPLMDAWRAQHPGKSLNYWAQVMRDPALQQGVQEFQGRGWDVHLADALVGITNQWSKTHGLSLAPSTAPK